MKNYIKFNDDPYNVLNGEMPESGEIGLIYVKCKTCGWRLPFSSKENVDNVKNRGING